MAYELKSTASWTTILVCVFGVGAATASDLDVDGLYPGLPAVSDLNAKFAVGGGAFEDTGVGFVEGAISFPVTHSTGLQVDGLAGFGDDGGYIGGGAHFFWRDPATGLLGVYGSVTSVDLDNNDYTHLAGGLEAAAYFGQFSLEIIAGLEGGDNVEDGFFTIANLAYYPTEDLRLYAGVRYIQEDFIGAAGAEYQFNLDSFDQPLALFAEGRVGDDEAEVWAGLRVYLGRPNSLIGRHREDDPAVPSLDFLFESTVTVAPTAGGPTPTTTASGTSEG
ncbi:MAG: hypothetical protein Rhims3KO_18160 [Hyphomicrobiales bacterium]